MITTNDSITVRVLSINAGLLILGAILQGYDGSQQELMLTWLFIAWIVTLVWFVAMKRQSRSLN